MRLPHGEWAPILSGDVLLRASTTILCYVDYGVYGLVFISYISVCMAYFAALIPHTNSEQRP